MVEQRTENPHTAWEIQDSARGLAMVTKRTLEKYVNEAEVIAEEIDVKPEIVTKVLRQVEVRIENNKRQPRLPAPEGGISLSAAERKYKIPNPTLSRWAKKGYIPILLRTKRELYIDELSLTKLVERYKQDPGQGKKTINNQGGQK